MALRKPGKVSWHNILNAPFVHFTGRDMPGLYQFAQPCRGEGINFVVVGWHLPPHSAVPERIQNLSFGDSPLKASSDSVEGKGEVRHGLSPIDIFDQCLEIQPVA
jgi:hypothetical protein